MLCLFDELQKGLLSPNTFKQSYTSKQIFNMELSKYASVRETDGNKNAMDIEQVDQRYLLYATDDNGVYVHDLYNTTGKPKYVCEVVGEADRYSIHNHEHSISTVQWYPFDTGMFSTSGLDHKLKLWNTNRMFSIVMFPFKEKVFSHHMSPIATNHSIIATGQSYPNVILVDIRTGSRCHELYGHTDGVLSVRWSPNCEYLLASGSRDNQIFLWDIRAASRYLKALDLHNGEINCRKGSMTAHSGEVNSLCFSPDGLYLVSFGTDCRVRLWDVARAQNTMVNYGITRNKSYKNLQMDICYNASVPTIFVPSGNKVMVYDMFQGIKLTQLVAHFCPIHGCKFRSLYNDLYSIGCDKKIHVWTSTNEPVKPTSVRWCD